MRHIIDWLVEFEKTAARFYHKAAAFFSNDRGLADLARRLAEDEEWHAEIMRKASEQLKDKDPPPSLIKVDVDSKKEIADLFKKCEERFDSGEVTKKEFLNSIVKAEYSEWNTYLIYVVNSLKDLSDEFTDVPRRMQGHKRRIEEYVEGLGGSQPEVSGLLKKIGRLPDVWMDRFLLVVDDEDAIVDLLKAILQTKGVVNCAYNGEEALEKFNKRYYDVIVCDVDMPVMGGIEFYKKASEGSSQVKEVKERILFFTGDTSEERLSFFRENGLRYLEKPARIEEIIKAVNGILRA